MGDFSSPKKGSNIICRVSNATPEMVCRYVSRLPKHKMREEDFREYMGKSWFQNEHQAPEQWGLYYIDGTYYYPRFDRDITIEEAERYLYGWIKRLIVINPYTRFQSINDNRLVESIVKQLEINPDEHDLKTIFRNIIQSDEPFIVNEIIANALNTYSEVLSVKVIDKDNEKFHVSLLPNYKEILKTKYNMTKKEYFDSFSDINTSAPLNEPNQVIYFGAPGTGKSFEINKKTIGQAVVRTTFHPDSDYSTFVGAYKPTMEETTKCVVPVVVNNGISLSPASQYKEKQITYKFVKQAFLKAYLAAWKKFSEQNMPVVLNFTTKHGKYIILSVDDMSLTQSKTATIKKRDVQRIWDDPKFWDANKFILPKGPQPGTTVQQTVCSYIYNDLSCAKEAFEKGWTELIEKLKLQNISVSKTQTYELSYVDDESLAFRAIARNTKKAIEKYYVNPKNDNSVEQGIADILVKYNAPDFETAWGMLKKEVERKGGGRQYLVIEEINRGNCAQIFGDLFQLLDRSDNGFSTYPIEADSDLQQAIKEAFEKEKEYQLNNPIKVDEAVPGYKSNYGKSLSEDIQEGRILLLPPNLYIWATMNTSDQSLFPIDSAFKRRWDWEYIPIGYKNDNWIIEIGEKKYNWVDFQRHINGKIFEVDNSEDKQLGDYFVNADRTGGKISAQTLLNKILFYIWNDVCKDDPEQIFRWIDDKQEKSIKFSDFFDKDRDKKLHGFMAFNKINAIGESENTEDSETVSDMEGIETDETAEKSETEVKQ